MPRRASITDIAGVLRQAALETSEGVGTSVGAGVGTYVGMYVGAFVSTVQPASAGIIPPVGVMVEQYSLTEEPAGGLVWPFGQVTSSHLLLATCDSVE